MGQLQKLIGVEESAIIDDAYRQCQYGTRILERLSGKSML